MGAIKPETVQARPAVSALIEIHHLSRHLDQQGQRTLILYVVDEGGQIQSEQVIFYAAEA